MAVVAVGGVNKQDQAHPHQQVLVQTHVHCKTRRDLPVIGTRIFMHIRASSRVDFTKFPTSDNKVSWSKATDQHETSSGFLFFSIENKSLAVPGSCRQTEKEGLEGGRRSERESRRESRGARESVALHNLLSLFRDMKHRYRNVKEWKEFHTNLSSVA